MRNLILAFAIIASACSVRGQQTYHQLEMIPNQSGTVGELRFVESTGWTSGTGTGYVGFKAATTIATPLVWTLPATDSTGTQCLSSNGSGVLGWSACSGGGSSFYQTMEDAGTPLTQRAVLNFAAPAFVLADDAGSPETDVDLTTSPASAATLVGTGRLISTTSPLGGGGDLSADRTLTCTTCVTTDTVQTITGAKTLQATLTSRTIEPEAGNTYSLGTYGGFGSDKSYQFAHIRNIRSSQIAAGIWDTFGFTGYHRWEPGTINQSQIKDSSGTSVLGFNSNVTPDLVTVYGSLTVNSILTVSSTSTFTSAATFNGGVVMPSGTNSTIRAGSGGAIYITPRGIASTSVDCSTVADGWMEITTDNYLVLCRGAARYRAALASY